MKLREAEVQLLWKMQETIEDNDRWRQCLTANKYTPNFPLRRTIEEEIRNES